MWSDPTPPEQLRALVAQFHSVLPAPVPAASSSRCALRGQPSVEQVEELLRREPGFACVNATTQAGTAAPYLLRHPLATISYSGESATVSGPGGTVEISAPGFEVLQAALEAWRGPAGALLAGFLSYDLAAEIEDLGAPPPEDFRFPKFSFGLFDSALTFEDDRWSLFGTDAWRGKDGLPLPPSNAEDLLARAASTSPLGSDAPLSSGALSSRPDRASFEAAVQRTVATIHSGDIFQTNLCRCIETQLEPGREWDLYRRMRSISPSRYEAFLRIDDRRSILSISPELFLKVEAGVVESSPIKGTRPRARAAEADRALAEELLASEKDRAELAMIVDVVRNDLARVCEAGSVEVLQHAALMSLPTVHHIFSTVRGRLRAGAGTVELLRAAFPAASITGAPKIEAIRVAMREEGQRRGPCMGAIGWISLDGRLELSVAIRTAFVAEGRVRYYAGCGITSDSVPSDEFIESRHKAAAFVRALGREHDPHW
jgi:para-aminobenzoate synthetase component 1